ncbi:MAG: hypothetical protein N4A33_02715 [Bacteriovoracaceae bacterium]|nr:hypothetical protein [Bacteriovoracaceae bacterium]
MSRLGKFFAGGGQVKLYESGQEAVENKFPEKEKSKRRNSWKRYLAMGASIAVMSFASPKDANPASENTQNSDLNLKNNIELADLNIQQPNTQNAVDYQKAAVDSVRAENIKRISDFIKNQDKKDLTFSISLEHILMLGDEPLVGKKGKDYEKLSYALFEDKLAKATGSYKRPQISLNCYTLLNMLDKERGLKLVSSKLKSRKKQLQKLFDKERAQNLSKLEANIEKHYDKYLKRYSNEIQVAKVPEVKKQEDKQEDKVENIEKNKKDNDNKLGEVKDNKNKNKKDKTFNKNENKGKDKASNDEKHTSVSGDKYDYQTNLKQAQKLMSSLSRFGSGALALVDLSYSPKARELIKNIIDPFELKDGSKAQIKIKSMKDDIKNISDKDTLSYVDYSNPNEPTLFLSNSLFVSKGEKSSDFLSKQRHERSKNLVYGLKELEAYKNNHGVSKDALRDLDLIKSFDAAEKQCSLIEICWEQEKVSNKNPKILNGKLDKVDHFSYLCQGSNNVDESLSSMAKEFSKYNLLSSENITLSKKEAMTEYFKGDEYMAEISKIYSCLEEKEPLKEIIKNVKQDHEKEYLLSLAIPTLSNKVSGKWLEDAIKTGVKFKVEDLNNLGGYYDPNPKNKSITIKMGEIASNQDKVEKYSHLLDFSHELRHFWQDQKGLMVDGNSIQEKLIMNRCLEADANVGAIFAMNSFKEDNGWNEPYEYAKDDKSLSPIDNFNEDLIQKFEKGKNESEAASFIFKEWFKLYSYVGLPKLTHDLKDDYALSFANDIKVSEYVGKPAFDITSQSFDAWLEGFTVPSDDDKYVTKHIGIDFLNKSENKNVDEKTYNKLVKKIEDYIKLHPEKKLSIEEEKKKLPPKYDKDFMQILYENGPKDMIEDLIDDKVKKSNETEILNKKQIEAKQKIVNYKIKQKSKNAKLANKVALLRNRGRI